MKKYLTVSVNPYTENVIFYSIILYLVKISADIMDYCLTRYARILVLFYFSFFTAEIIKQFCQSECNFQVTYGLYLYIKL